jgi:hypothetical protein
VEPDELEEPDDPLPELLDPEVDWDEELLLPTLPSFVVLELPPPPELLLPASCDTLASGASS